MEISRDDSINLINSAMSNQAGITNLSYEQRKILDQAINNVANKSFSPKSSESTKKQFIKINSSLAGPKPRESSVFNIFYKLFNLAMGLESGQLKEKVSKASSQLKEKDLKASSQLREKELNEKIANLQKKEIDLTENIESENDQLLLNKRYLKEKESILDHLQLFDLDYSLVPLLKRSGEKEAEIFRIEYNLKKLQNELTLLQNEIADLKQLKTSSDPLKSEKIQMTVPQPMGEVAKKEENFLIEDLKNQRAIHLTNLKYLKERVELYKPPLNQLKEMLKSKDPMISHSDVETRMNVYHRLIHQAEEGIGHFNRQIALIDRKLAG